jgi:hypothetical protein
MSATRRARVHAGWIVLDLTAGRVHGTFRTRGKAEEYAEDQGGGGRYVARPVLIPRWNRPPTWNDLPRSPA